MNPFYCRVFLYIACILFLMGCNAAFNAGNGFDEASHSYEIREGVLQNEPEGACFAADTLVMMADGTSKKIIDIQRGDRVKSFELETGKVVDTEVIKTKSGIAGYHYVINGGLKVTPPHPFCTPDDKWVRIKDLKEGQTVRISNSIRKISSIEHIMEGQRIYNIFVKDNHNYFVSGDGKDFFL